jgi:hypothetical protein
MNIEPQNKAISLDWRWIKVKGIKVKGTKVIDIIPKLR